MGHGGIGVRQKQVIQPATWTGQGFWAIFPVFGRVCMMGSLRSSKGSCRFQNVQQHSVSSGDFFTFSLYFTFTFLLFAFYFLLFIFCFFTLCFLLFICNFTWCNSFRFTGRL